MPLPDWAIKLLLFLGVLLVLPVLLFAAGLAVGALYIIGGAILAILR